MHLLRFDYNQIVINGQNLKKINLGIRGIIFIINGKRIHYLHSMNYSWFKRKSMSY